MDAEADGLAERRRGAVGERHQPRLERRGREGKGRNARAEREAFKRLVEGNGNQQDEKGRARAHGQRHADEDAVEENAAFEEQALEQQLAVCLRGWVHGGGVVVVVVVVGIMTVKR